MPEIFTGATINAGSFPDEKTGKTINYNNLMMSFLKPGDVGLVVNAKKPLVKVKNTREDILRIFGEMITMKWLNDRRNWYADVFYDESQRVSRIIFYGPDDPFGGQPSNAPALTPAEGISDYQHAEAPAEGITDYLCSEAPASSFATLEDQLNSMPDEKASAPADKASMPDDKKGGKK